MKQLSWLILIMSTASLAISGCNQGVNDRVGYWRKVGADYNFDISGIVFLERKNDINTYLVCHDNKYPDEDRIGIITLALGAPPQYRPLRWPEDIEKPIDFESLAHINWNGDDTVYVAMTSRGWITSFVLDSSRTAVEVVYETQLPMSRMPGNLEGFAALRHEDRILTVWGDRGQDEIPGMIYWAWFDTETFEFDFLDSLEYSVPWPQRSEVRHISELKMDEAGVLYITAASEVSNDGPFQGACYIAGAFHFDDDEVHFSKNSKPVRIFAFEGYKVEAFDFVPGPHGGVIFGTDNENEGAYLYYYD